MGVIGEYEFGQAAQKIKLARYLLTKADNRGLTHGEKHFLMQTALMLLHEAQTALVGEFVGIERHQLESLNADDIPF